MGSEMCIRDRVSTELIDEISDDINDKYTELFYLISENDEM